jgi:hypothetical protein
MRLLTKNLRLKCVERKDPNALAANSGTVIMRFPLHAVSSKIFVAAQFMHLARGLAPVVCPIV